MGNRITVYKNKPDHLPETGEAPTFDPDFGFPRERIPRTMIATEEEMRAAKIPLAKRDYCAHLLIDFESCKRKYWPFPVMCRPEQHKYFHCEFEDYVLRMKEFEREKRLRLREQRIAVKAGEN